MNVLTKTVETTQEVATTAVDAGKKTKKTALWVGLSTIIGLIIALLADQQVLKVAMDNPKVALWIPVINVVLIYGEKLFKEFKSE